MLELRLILNVISCDKIKTQNSERGLATPILSAMSAPPTNSQLGEKQPSITRTLIQSFIYLSLLNAFLIIFVGMSLGPTRNIRHLAIYWACMTGSLLFLTTVASIIAHHNGKVLIWRCMFHEVYQFGVLGGLHLLPKEQSTL